MSIESALVAATNEHAAAAEALSQYYRNNKDSRQATSAEPLIARDRKAREAYAAALKAAGHAVPVGLLAY